MGKFIKYIAAGLLAAYAVHGGCDKNIDDVLEDRYSIPILATRKVVVDFVYRKIGSTYKKIEMESQRLEERVNGGTK